MRISALNVLPQSREVRVLEALLAAELPHDGRHLAVVAVRHAREHVVLDLDVEAAVREDEKIAADI